MPWRPWRHKLGPSGREAIVDMEHPLLPTVGLTCQDPVAGLNADNPIRLYGRTRRAPRTPFATTNAVGGDGPFQVSGSYGRAYRLSGNRMIRFRPDTAPTTALGWSAVMGASRKTVVCGLTPTGTSTSNANTYSLPRIWGDTGLYLGMHRGNAGGAGDRIWAYNYSGGDHKAGVTYTVGQPLVFAYTHNGTTLRAYKDGRFVQSAASGATDDTTGSLVAGAQRTGFGDDDVHFLYFYDRVLSPGQVAEVSLNPWAFFLEKAPTRYFVPTGAPVTGKPWTYQRMMSA